MREKWKRWLSVFLAAVLLFTSVPVPTLAQMTADSSGKPTTIKTANSGEVEVEESWEETYPYGAFLFVESDMAVAEGGEEAVITLYRLGGTSGRATAYVVYAPVTMQMTEDRTSYGSAAGYGDVEISVEDTLPIARYQPIGKDPDPEPSAIRILEKEAETADAEAGDRVLYLDGTADSYQWYGLLDGRWQLVDGATDADFLLSEELLSQYDFRCVFTKDGQRFCTDSIKGEAYVKPEEEVLQDAPEDIDLAPEKSFTAVPMDPENPYSAQILALTFADGEWSKEIRVKAPENEKAQPLRFGTFTILDHQGGDIFKEASLLTLKVEDNDKEDPYTIRFEETEVRADKSKESAIVKLRRVGGGQNAVTVEYETVDGTAVAGKDYRHVSGSAVFYGDIDEFAIEVPLYNDGDEGEEPRTFKVALGELKGDAEGLCTLADTEAQVILTNEGTPAEEETPEMGEDSDIHKSLLFSKEGLGGVEEGVLLDGTSGLFGEASDQGDASGLGEEPSAEDDASGLAGESPEDDTPGLGEEPSAEDDASGLTEEAEIPEHDLPAGSLADAFRQGADASEETVVSGEQVVTPEEDLLQGEIAGLEGAGSGGPLRTYSYGRITFEKSNGGNYWDDEAYIAGRSPNTLTGWSSGGAYGNGWQIKSDDTASASLTIDHMSKMYSRFYGSFEFDAHLDNGWHLYNGYAYGYATLSYQAAGVPWLSTYSQASSNPRLTTSGFLGINRHLHYYKNGSISSSWDMKTDLRSVDLRIGKHENKSENDVYSRITYGYLTRRVLENNLSLVIHTANDGESGGDNVATAPEGGAAFDRNTGVYNNIKPTVTIENGAGGVDWAGRLYVGSKLKISLSSTDSFKPFLDEALNAAIYVTRSDGRIVARSAKGSGSDYYVTMLWDDMTEDDLSDSYTLHVVMMRQQDLELNLQPAVERLVNQDGSVSMNIDPTKIGKAWEDFWKSGADRITVGYSEKTDAEPYFSSDKIVEKEYRKSDWESGDNNPLKRLSNLYNVQYINFNRSSKDRFTLNGKMYKGDERIYLSMADLSVRKISITYYSESCLNKPNIMTTSVVRTELYFDGDGDERIAGSFNTTTGYFDLESDTADRFVMYLEEDGSYDEINFQPELLENGKYGQYFVKVLYSMTPRSLNGQGGYAQVLPALATTRTNDASLAKLTQEQRKYRYLLSGPGADGVRTSDNHPMYGAEATAYQYVDAPLGGDRSPLYEAEKDVYEWTPKFVGNLLYPFESPEPIYIEHSLAGDNYPLAEVEVDPQNGYSLDKEGKANINGYLGSFVGDTTIALCVTEQRLTSDQLHDRADSEKNLTPESTELIRRSAAPNGAWLTKIDSGDMGGDGFDTADSGQDYSEFNTDYDFDLPVVKNNIPGLCTLITGKNSLSILISIPLYSWSKSNGGKMEGKGFPSTVTGPWGKTLDQVEAYGEGMKNGSYTEIEKALQNGGYKKNDAGRLESSKVGITISFSAIFTLKYDTKENTWYLQEFVFGAGGSLSLSYNIRLAACPLVYGFISVNAQLTVVSGGTYLRKAVESDYPIVSKGKMVKLKKGESLPFETPYVNATIDFSGKILIKPEKVGDEKVNTGYLTSKGGKEIALQFKTQKKGNTMTFDDEMKGRKITIIALEDTTINYLNIVESVNTELTWSGVKLIPKLIAEIGVGAGVEGIKVEAFIKSVISASFTFGKPMEDGSRKGAAVDNASFTLSLAIRAVLFFSSWELDAVGVKAAYDGKTDKWTTSYILLGKDYPMKAARGLAGDGEDSSSHLPEAFDKTQTIYSSQPGNPSNTHAESASSASTPLLRAYKPEDPNVPFQLSGYNSSSEAFRLADGLTLGCDYKVVTVNGNHYVVYTVGRPGGKGMDTTMLALSRLVLEGEGYGQNVGQSGEEAGDGQNAGQSGEEAGDGLGLVNPLDWEEVTDEEGNTHQVVKAPGERSEIPYILIDLKKNEAGELTDDGTGDQDFDVKVIGDKIYVAWVSYAKPVAKPSSDARIMLQEAARNTVVRQAAFDVTKKEGFSEAVDLSDPEGESAVYLPKIVNAKYTAYVRATHPEESERAELVARYAKKLEDMGYFPDGNTGGSRAIYEYRLQLYENTLECKGDGSELCVYVDSDEGVYQNQKVFAFPTKGGSEEGYASDEAIAPLDKLAVFERGDGDIYAAYTTWQEDLDSSASDSENVSALYLTSFHDAGKEEGITCPYGQREVSSEYLDPTKQDETLLVYEGKTLGLGSEVETLLFVGQGGKVYMIPAERVPAFLKEKGAGSSGNLLEKTAFSGGDALDRRSFVFGGDGDGNLVAVYVGEVENTTNTGLFLSVFDRKAMVWGAGTILAMRHMDVFEDAARYKWSDEDADKAYLGELEGYSDGIGLGRGGMDQFQFTNPQIALGVKAETDKEGDQGEATDFESSNTTLTILTQGMMRYLAYEEVDGERFLTTGAEPPADAAFKEGLGVYAITYGVGHQSIGQAGLSFVQEDFTAGAQLVANLSFVNTGDIGIRGSEDNPITVTLTVEGEGLPSVDLASWTVKDSIYPGQQVELTADFTLPATLPDKAGFGLRVSEDASYAEDPYSAALRDIYIVNGGPEIAFETATIELCKDDNGILSLDEEGNAYLSVDLFVGNRGTEDAENAYLQFSYGIHDPALADEVKELNGEGSDWNDAVYVPLDITGHKLVIGEEKPLLRSLAGKGDNLSGGILYLDGLRAGYGRQVTGKLAVPAQVFSVFGDDRDKETAGSLKLSVEVFSDGDEVETDAFGLHAAEHGEYNGLNNRYGATIEHTTAFGVPNHLEVPVGTQLRLPVAYSTTLGIVEPDISVAEMLDREVPSANAQNGLDAQRRTDVLTWQPRAFANGKGSGTLILRGGRTGTTYIRLLDSKTNAYQDMAVTFTEADKGLDITNSNGYFTFLDTTGKKVTTSGTDWIFQEHILTWRGDEKPFKETLSLGLPGTSIRFTTEAEELALDFQGGITVNCDAPGFEPISLEGAETTCTVSLGENPDNLPRTVTIQVDREAFPGTEDRYAYFDRLVERYAGDGEHAESQSSLSAWWGARDLQLVWATDFPESESLKAGEVFETTVFGVIDGVLLENAKPRVECQGDHVELLSTEFQEWGSYGQRFAARLRFTGNGPATITLGNDKHDEYQYTLQTDWWKPGASAFTLKEDPAYQAYAKKYPELARKHAQSGNSQKLVEYEWMQAEADERGGAVTVHIDKDAPAESFEILVGSFAQYLENHTLPREGAVVGKRGETVSVPTSENDLILVHVEAQKRKGENSALDYEIHRKDGSVESYNAEDAFFFNRGLVEVPKAEDLLCFKSQSVALTGQIGVNFFMNLPNIQGVDYHESYMEFTVSGEKQVAPFDENAMNSSGKYFRFTCLVNAVQMAEEIKAVFHYFRNGVEKTLERTYSVKQYVQDFDAHGGYGKKVTNLVHALADYGHYAQPYLSKLHGWEIGTDYAEMDLHYKEKYTSSELTSAKSDLQKWAFSCTKAKDVTGVNCSLYLDSGTGISLFFTVKEGYAGEVAVTVDGEPYEPKRLADGRYQVRIHDIPAHRLGTTYTVKVKTDAGTTKVKASALSYVFSSLMNKPDKDKKNAMLALYRYYKAAAEYLA